MQQKNILFYQIRVMNPFTKIWFWLLILSIIGFVLTFIFFETMGQTSSGNNSTPGWIWIIFILSIIFFIVAFILYAIDLSAYHRRMEIAEACGELPPPPPKKKIECPKRECVEKRVVECVEKKRDPCDTQSQVVVDVTPANQVVQTTQYVPATQVVQGAQYVPTTQVITTNQAIPGAQVITLSPDEAFSAAGLKPLATLAPTAIIST